MVGLAFSLAENRGVFALLLGSGISRPAQIPTGWEITSELTRRLATASGVADGVDPTEWYTAEYGEPPSYSRLIDIVAKTADERRSILHGFIDPTPEEIEEGKKVPTAAHRAIAKLVRDGFIRVIVTTNFDRLLENALRDEGIEPTVVKSDDDLKGAVPLIHTRCFILKVHGDYMDTRIRNTEQELGSYSPEFDVLLDRILDEHGLIVCGWSGQWDLALRGAITRAPSRRYPMYWASRTPPAGVAGDLVAHRRAHNIAIADADAFFIGIQQKVETLAALGRTHPRSVELLVAAAKRHITGPQGRVQLFDIVREEARRARQIMEAGNLYAQGEHSEAPFVERVLKLEAVSEPIVRLLYTLGRWGDGSETSLAEDLLNSFTKRRDSSGFTLWIALPTYPGLLLWYAYAIGALKAQRYATVYNWLAHRVENIGTGEDGAAVLSLFLWTWEGSRGWWSSLAGAKQRMAPYDASFTFHDHLQHFLGEQLSSEFVSSEDFDATFERFSLLASLAHITISTNLKTLQEASKAEARQLPFIIPVAPSGHISFFKPNPFLVELQTHAMQETLRNAGFGGPSPEHLQLAVKFLGDAVGSMRF
jgi:hypothetical protein